MSKAPTSRGPAASGKKAFEHKDGNGSLFYDEPGVPTLSGSLKYGKTYSVTGEPQVDKNQVQYTRIMGDGLSGGLYPNERKENERHPDFTGPIEIDGQRLRISAWEKEIKAGQSAGQKFLSVSVSEPRARENA